MVTLAQVVVLYVEQEESVRRQLNRAQLAAKHNTRVLDAGAGDLWELRPTDVDDAKCRRSYDVFKVAALLPIAFAGLVSFSPEQSLPLFRAGEEAAVSLKGYTAGADAVRTHRKEECHQLNDSSYTGVGKGKLMALCPILVLLHLWH